MRDDRDVIGRVYDPETLRAEMLVRRRALTAGDVARNSSLVVERLRGLPELLDVACIGSYVGVRGEVDPAELLESSDEQQIAFPVTTPGKPLRFVIPGGELVDGPFGIRQPSHGLEVNPLDLNVVLVPLVAVDYQGNRVGHGGGYYDRTFSEVSWRHRPAPDRAQDGNWAPLPLLIGLCHEFQVVSAIEARPWDVPVHMVVTEVGLIRP